MKSIKNGKPAFMAVTMMVGAVSAAMMAFTAVLNICAFLKIVRCTNTVQKSLPEIEKAARLYRKNNTEKETGSVQTKE
ncbi:hypothetical protein [Caproiciproducens faecalis]|uniref:Oxaloacetate decarboxylase, gamma chain n=1 Tax=Caproiciproducens faecalis TaxID=2820301 RepID=A0ABS7DQT0_9FIRM|nr:hypothetical protein [Caproiciproducens faecalis]MBW7573658.1 hypothetical protein [Caproiciproducens faecalis]